MEFKVHDRVRVRPDPGIGPEFHNKEGEVVGPYGRDAILIKIENLLSTRHDGAWIFMSPSKYLDIISTPVKEQPCQTCSRMNDTSATACWWCGNKPR